MISTPRKTQSLVIAALLVGLVSVTGATAGTVRGHTTHRHGSSHSGWYFGPSYGYSYGYAYGYRPYYYGYGYGYPGPYYGGYYGTPAAYIDTDIQPEDTAVYLDGEPVGTVDDFDGFPRYLAVTPGRHQLTFKAEGHRSVTRSVRVPNGALLQLDFTLPRGDSRRDVDAQGEAEIVVPDPSPDDASPPAAAPDDTERDEADDEAELQEEQPEEDAPQSAEEPGFLKIEVEPGDASVYLDGELLGPASKLTGLHGEMRIEPGVHRIEAVRPGYRAGTRRIEVSEGQHLSIELTLRKVAPPPDRSR